MPSLAAIAWFITRASESAYGCSVFLRCLVIWRLSPGEWFGGKTTQFKVAFWQILHCLTSSWEFILWLFPFKTKYFQVSLCPFLYMYLFPGFKSRRRRHMCVEFVEGPIFCSERFISVYPGFLLSSKSNITKFQFEYHRAHRLSIFFEVEYINTDNVIAFCLSLTNKMRRNIFGARKS